MEDKNILAEITADVVSAYVTRNKVPASELPGLISSVHQTFARLVGQEVGNPQISQLPAVPVGRSVTDDFLVCLEDGMEFKSLKRHLKSHHNLSPEQYREKWSLPVDYPMVAPSYSLKRSKLAREIGLGRTVSE